MPNLKRIVTEIAALPDQELRKFSIWFAEFEAKRWDRGLQGDISAGKLDELATEALAEHAAGRCKPL
jgi:hypothetical protein